MLTKPMVHHSMHSTLNLVSTCVHCAPARGYPVTVHALRKVMTGRTVCSSSQQHVHKNKLAQPLKCPRAVIENTKVVIPVWHIDLMSDRSYSCRGNTIGHRRIVCTQKGGVARCSPYTSYEPSPCHHGMPQKHCLQARPTHTQ